MNINFKELANKYQTPYYVYDFDHITKQYEELKSAFKARKSLIAYAVKANSNLSVIKHLAQLGAGADCVSIGEVRRALKVGIAPYKIIFSYKTLVTKVPLFPTKNLPGSQITVISNPNIVSKTDCAYSFVSISVSLS